MESLGEKLRTAREAKGVSYDQAGKDTKIAIRYLEGLEREDFSSFPGETYVTGFLRNYGAYLEMDVQELLSLYHALKIQEQPVPVEQLLRKPSPWPKLAIGAALAVLVLGGIGGGIAFLVSRPRNREKPQPVQRNPVEHVMSGDSFEQRFYRGDSVLIPLMVMSGGEMQQDFFKMELQSLGDAVTIRTPAGQVILDLSQEASVDLDNSGAPDIRVVAVDYAKNNADMGVLLRFETNAAPPLASDSGAGIAETASISGQVASTVVFSSPNPYPFTLQSVFQGYCMFRWEILMERDRRDRNEQYFQRSDELNIQAQNGIRVWISNAQAVKFSIIGGGRTVPVEVGIAGEVVVADIRWVRDDDNRYRLIVARLEA